MAHVRLLHQQRRSGAAQIDELKHVESCRAAQDIARLAGSQLRQRLDEQLGQPLLAAPAHDAALERIGRIGIGGGELREVRAVLEPLERLLGAGAPRFQLLGTRLLGHPHQNVRDAVLGRRVLSSALLEKKILDLALADGDLAGDFAFAQARDQDLVAQFLAKFVETDFIALEATRLTVRSSSRSSTRSPVSRANCSCTFSTTRRSST